MRKTLIVTGGCGFIGTNISLFAKKKGYKVIAFDSLIRPYTEDNAVILKKEGIEIIRGDVRNEQDLERLPKKAVGIIHLAGNPGIPWSIKWPLYDFFVNTNGTLNILEFSRKNNLIPVIFASTNKVYSEEINLIPTKDNRNRFVWDFNRLSKNLRKAVLEGVSKNGVNEKFPMDSVGVFPHSPYGVSKASADLYCQEYFHIYHVPVVVNRMSCIYGLFQKGVEDQGWLDWFVRAKLKNTPLNIYGNGKQVRDCLFGEDLAELYLLELEKINKIKGQVFNVGGGVDNTASLLEVIEYIEKKSKTKFKLNFKKWRPADQRIYISDISKVKNILGWEPSTSVREGIDQIWNQYTKGSN